MFGLLSLLSSLVRLADSSPFVGPVGMYVPFHTYDAECTAVSIIARTSAAVYLTKSIYYGGIVVPSLLIS